VILVGAGPGDPDLITLKGAAALRRADVVVYDALAPSELLDLAPASAQRINVGKRGHEAPTRSQEETVELLLQLARDGKTVVRLKGRSPPRGFPSPIGATRHRSPSSPATGIRRASPRKFAGGDWPRPPIRSSY
jgi:diphthamide biosynthesis methyltransferase